MPMMTESEANLLHRFVHRGDADAFAHLTRLYASMVYGTCLRVTGNPEEAADAAQDTFFDFLKNARKVSGSLGGWLHQVATRRAIDLVRRDSSRRQREQAYAAQAPLETDHWAEVSPLVDEAMNELSEPLREVLVRHFLQGQTTVQIAATQSVAQSTVSRHVEQALAQLRDKLRAKGVLVAITSLGAWLSQTAQSAPATVLAELGKMAVAASGGAASSATVAALSGLKVKLAAAAVVASVGIGGYVAYKQSRTDGMSSAGPAQLAPNTVQAMTEPSTAPANAPSPLPASSDAATSPGPVPAAPLQGSAVVQETPTAPAPPLGGPRFGAAFGDPAVARPPMGFGGFGTRMATAPSPTSPQGAVQQFAGVLRRGDWSRLEQCFVPGSAELAGFQRLLQNPQNDEERSMKQCMESLGQPVEITETTPWEDGLKVKWKATVRKPFSLVEDGMFKNWQEGDKFELEVRLKKVGDNWRIAGF